MRNIFVLIIVMSFVFTALISFASDDDPIRIYTFKKDRVDQSLEGNRGYLLGKPKNIPEKKRNLQRTLIGVDIELPCGGSEEGEEKSVEKKPKKAAKPAAKEPAKSAVKEEYIK